MKVLNTPTMRKMLDRAERKIKRTDIKSPNEGLLITVISKETRRGYWQIEYIHDHRRQEKPYLAAYYFKGHKYDSLSADYVLTRSL